MSDAIILPIDSFAAQEFMGALGRDLSRFPKEFTAAIVRALNRTMKGSQTQALGIITSRYAVRRATIAKRLWSRKAGGGRLYFHITLDGEPILLSRFAPKGRVIRKTPRPYSYTRDGQTISVTPKKRRSYKGVTVKVLKEGGRKLVQGGFFMPGRTPIFRKEGAGFKALHGPSLVPFLNRAENRERIEGTAHDRLRRELAHEAEFRLKKLGAA